ncbi:MAG: SDR family oxidoreductase [Betaproteobacteria bacterium]|jgi:NAD(P)-dependent dehydrogenase (short-subunit alcohol dehydrogenase family)|nr:MAG: SDR family oxidoreductase [Betaproteobacteria bacterium]
MDMQLIDRRALITGSTSGIGYAIARALAAEGAHVTLTGRTQQRVDDALAKLRLEIPRAKAAGVAADCATAAGARTVFDNVPDTEILVNNLGIYERKPFFEIPDEDWERMFEVNVMSGVRFTRFYTPKMVERQWGRVIFVSSESGLNIPPEMIHYGFSKTAQLSISRGLAMALSGTGVTVNSLLPGPTRTATTEKMRKERAAEAGISLQQLEDEFFERFRPSSIIRRFADVDEVAPLAVYLCSPLSAITTGAALRVEGGIVNQIT